MENILQDKSQGWKNILKLIIPYIFIVGTCQMIGYYFAGLDITNYQNIHKTPKESFIVTFSTLVSTFITVWLFRKFVDKKTFASLGFEKILIAKDIFIGLILGFIIMLSGFTCLILSKQLEFLTIQFNLTDLLLSIGIFIFVAISEEVLLRGYILNNLMTSFNKYFALIISSVIFSLLHVANPNFNLFSLFELFISGLFLGLAYIYTKSLWFPIALHFSWNFFQGTIFGFNVSGIEQYSLIVTKYKTANIWNGGGFGFEGSILSVFFQLFSIVIIILIFKKRLTKNNLLG